LKEKVKPIWDKVKGFFGGLSKAVKIAIAVVLIAAIAIIIGLVVYNGTRPYTVLYTQMNQDDMQQVLEYLGSNNITDFKIRNDDTILVPEQQADSLKAKLAMSGYPKSGFAYGTYLNNVGMLSSQADRDLLEGYELQDRLAATIEWFDGVQQAAVNITFGEDNRYILNREDAVPASATVIVTMKEGQVLSSQQAKAIRNLVAKSVSGLAFDEVVLSDTAGNDYMADEETGDISEAAALKLSLQKRVNSETRDKIKEVLVPLFGEKNVNVSVNSTVDVSRSWRETVTYSSPDETAWNSLGGHGLIGEYVYDDRITRDGEQPAGGVPGTTTNSDLNEYMTNPENLTGNEQELGTSGSVTYQNNEDRTQQQSAGGVITDVMVAVSINSTEVDGNLNVLDVVSHVARASGIAPEIQNDKISVLAWPFYEEPAPQEEPLSGLPALLARLPDWALYAIIIGTVLFFLLLIVAIILVRRAKKRKAQQQVELEAGGQGELSEDEAGLAELMGGLDQDFDAEAQEQGAQIMDMHSEHAMELRKDVREFAEQNPEIAAQMVKAWLKGGEEHA